MQLLDGGGQAFGEAGDVGLVVAADGEDDGVGGVGAVLGFEMEAGFGAGEKVDGGVRL